MGPGSQHLCFTERVTEDLRAQTWGLNLAPQHGLLLRLCWGGAEDHVGKERVLFLPSATSAVATGPHFLENRWILVVSWLKLSFPVPGVMRQS